MVYFAKHADDTDLHRLPLMLFQATICLLPGPSMAGIVKFRRVNQAAERGFRGSLAKPYIFCSFMDGFLPLDGQAGRILAGMVFRRNTVHGPVLPQVFLKMCSGGGGTALRPVKQAM